MIQIMNIVQMSVQAGVLIAAIGAVRAIALYRLPKTSFLALWGVAVARMLIPFSLKSQWSIYNLFGRQVKGAAIPEGGYVTVWAGQAAMPLESAAPSIPPLQALWLGGMAVLVFVFAVLLVRNYRALRGAVPVEDHAVITKWREEHRLFRPLRIVRSDKVSSPLSVGILRPRIIFPQEMALDQEQTLCYVLAHEYFHIRRFDTLWKLLALCAACIHWFNPLAWVMLILFNRDLELSCDEMVLRHFGGMERASYAHSLIDMAERRRSFSIIHCCFSKNAVEERIIAIMKYKKTSVLAILLALVLVAGMTTAFATGAVPKDNDSSLPDGQAPVSERNNGETGPHDNESTPSGLISVNRGDESKFTPEEWAEILKGVEAGKVLIFETAEEERAGFDDEDNNEHIQEKGGIGMTLGDSAVVTFVTKDSAPFAVLVDESECKAESGDTPYYIADEARVKTVEAGGSTYKWFSSEGTAYTDIASGAEIPVGTVTLGDGGKIAVSLSCRKASDISAIEVDLKKALEDGTGSSEKQVIKEAGSDSFHTESSVEKSGEYVLYVKNTGAYSAAFSLSYLIH